MYESRFAPKTEKKLTLPFPNHYQSLTDIKNSGSAHIINAESISPCLSKKMSTVSTSSESVKEQLIDILEESDCPATCRLLKLVKQWLQHHWKSLRMQVSNRLSKLKYLQPSLIGQSFSSIEKEILVEWRKNNLLQGLQLLWNHVFLLQSFENLTEIQFFYDTIRNIILQMTYLLFKQALNSLSNKEFKFEQKIYQYTAVTIITSKKEWKEVVNTVIKPRFYKSCPSFSENYDLQSLNARSEIIDPSSSTLLFLETAVSLSRLQQSYSLAEIVSCLKDYRKNLLHQIQNYIEEWRERNRDNKQIVLEKEDILNCIIYILVKHKLDNIGTSLKYISFLLKDQIDIVLGSFQVDCYRVDLEVAIQYLTQPSVRLSIQNFDKLIEDPSV